MGMLEVGRAQYLTFEWACGAQKTLKVHTGDHIPHSSIPIFILQRGIKRLEAESQNNGTYIDLDFLRCLAEIYGVILTDPFTDTTFLLLKIKAAFIDICDKGNGLSVIYMDGFVIRYLLIEWIRVLDRTIFYTGGATDTFVLVDVSGLLRQGNPKIPRLPFDFINFSEA
jgi:hypothetical protein